MEKILEIKNLNKNYNSLNGEIQVLKNINLDIYKGEIISLIGPSGCGKSSILNILTNLDNEYSGSIINNNLNIGYMMQSDALFEWLTVYENSVLGLKIKNKYTNKSIEYVNKLLKKYGLHEFKDKYPKSLSGGMRQRVALIRTLALNVDILLLDEPFSALDYQTRLKISDDVYKIAKEENKTVIMVTHDISEAISSSDRVVVLTKRPSSIKKIYNIKLTNSISPIKNRKCKEFSYYYDLIWRDLDESV